MLLMMLFILLNFLIVLLLISVNIIFMNSYSMMREKNCSFECGFEAFESTRLPFSIQFYLISVLFLVFDMEIIFLFPMMISMKMMSYKIWLICSFFILIILFLGLEYEKNEGLLKWYI